MGCYSRDAKYTTICLMGDILGGVQRKMISAPTEKGKKVLKMAKYIDREALIEWLKRIPLKDLSDGLGLCRVIMEDDFKKAIKKMPKGIIVGAVPVSELEELRDYLYSEDLIFMRGLAELNKLIANCGTKMDGGDSDATD